MLLTWWTLIRPSLNPANNFLPSAFHVKAVHIRFLDFFPSFFGWLGFNCSDWFGRGTHQIPDFDCIFSSYSDPLHLRVESDLVDGGSGVKFSGVVGKIEDIPDIEFFIFTSGGDVFTIW